MAVVGAISGKIRRLVGYACGGRLGFQSSDLKPGWRDMAVYFGPWWRSFREPEGLSERSLPWLTLPAVEFVKSMVTPDMRVFEFGSGASTIFFARHCREVQSIEHDPAWADKVEWTLQSLGMSNVRLDYFKPEHVAVGASANYRSGAARWVGLDFERYVRAIDTVEDHSLDLVLIDGRARIACVPAATNKLRAGGMLILDDSQRPRYQPAFANIPPAWRRIDFPGPCARTIPFGRTTIWLVPPETS